MMMLMMMVVMIMMMMMMNGHDELTSHHPSPDLTHSPTAVGLGLLFFPFLAAVSSVILCFLPWYGVPLSHKLPSFHSLNRKWKRHAVYDNLPLLNVTAKESAPANKQMLDTCQSQINIDIDTILFHRCGFISWQWRYLFSPSWYPVLLHTTQVNSAIC